MKNRFSFIIILPVFMLRALLPAQAVVEEDADAKKFMENYQKQNESLPRELLALMPAELNIKSKNWMVEPSARMLLTLSLESAMSGTRLENTESYNLALRISMTAYNLKSDAGKMMADQSLEMQRSGARDSWLTAHPESDRNHRKTYLPEKIVLPNGFILIQKTYSPAHGDGEGMVSERTAYEGFLYMDVTGGFLTAEVQSVPNTKAGIEKWLRQIASSAMNLQPGNYF
jgi:hypothetical protein